MTDWYKNSDTEYSTTWTVGNKWIVGSVWRSFDMWWWDVFTPSNRQNRQIGSSPTKEAAMSAAERASVQL